MKFLGKGELFFINLYILPLHFLTFFFFSVQSFTYIYANN